MGVDAVLNNVVEEAGDGERADAAGLGGDSGEVFAFADFACEVTF